MTNKIIALALIVVVCGHATVSIGAEYAWTRGSSPCSLEVGFHLEEDSWCFVIDATIYSDVTIGRDIYDGENIEDWESDQGFTIAVDLRSATEYGELRSYAAVDFHRTDGAIHNAELTDAFIELGGLRLGATSSQFDEWFGFEGGVVNNDVILYAGDMTSQIAYVGDLGGDLSFVVSLEQGAESELTYVEQHDDGVLELVTAAYDYRVTGPLPHLMVGAKLQKDWGEISVGVGYDSEVGSVAAKMRVDLEFNDFLSVFAMLGYQANAQKRIYFGAWNGDYAAWSGLSVELTSNKVVNFQAAYEQAGSWALALNMDCSLTDRLILTPELNFTSFGASRSTHRDAIGMTVELVSSF